MMQKPKLPAKATSGLGPGGIKVAGLFCICASSWLTRLSMSWHFVEYLPQVWIAASSIAKSVPRIFYSVCSDPLLTPVQLLIYDLAPMHEAVKHQVRTVRNSVNATSKYKGPPSPEVDRAWRDLFNSKFT